jgi:replicative DNA helicase|tara:strand:+ start:5165 stop:6658 length:1494 start_codon:yes stop_codon:yes gene_type:complete
MKKELSDVVSERAVLAGLIRHGKNAFIDIDGKLNEGSFTLEENTIIWSCLAKLFETSDTVDLSSLYAAAKSIDLDSVFMKRVPKDYYKTLQSINVELSNVKEHAKILIKYAIAREVDRKATQIKSNIRDINIADSTPTGIVSVAEAAVFNLIDDFHGQAENEPTDIGEDIDDYIQSLIDNPKEMMGLSTGFPRFDKAIGGGLRRGNVDLIAARAKAGKSLFADSVALHVAGNLGIPVLMLDTEMSREDHIHRLLANMSDIEINDISTGQFGKSSGLQERIKQGVEKLKELPYKYVTIAGTSFDETLSIMRRWLRREVGYDENGNTNPCLVIYDYLKLTSSAQMNDMKEFQALGYQMQQLVNFTIKEKVPCLSFVQLNRDGITRESEDVISGSDRLSWFCSSLTIFKKKSEEELAEDAGESGNRKLVPLIARHGGGLADDFDYINMSLNGAFGRIDEGFTKSEYILANKKQKEGFENEVSDKEEGFVVEEEIDEDKPF